MDQQKLIEIRQAFMKGVDHVTDGLTDNFTFNVTDQIYVVVRQGYDPVVHISQRLVHERTTLVVFLQDIGIADQLLGIAQFMMGGSAMVNRTNLRMIIKDVGLRSGDTFWLQTSARQWAIANGYAAAIKGTNNLILNDKALELTDG